MPDPNGLFESLREASHRQASEAGELFFDRAHSISVPGKNRPAPLDNRNLKATFGTNLKHFRKANNLSQDELSEKTGISAKHLSSIERGLTFVSADLLEKLADSVGVPIYCFFIKEDEDFYKDTALRVIELFEDHAARTFALLKNAVHRAQ